jgi:hypothetical protein
VVGAASLIGVRSATAGKTARYRDAFASRPDGDGWGEPWFAHHYNSRFVVRDGAARLGVPKGLRTTAPSQPMPVFLSDRDWANGNLTMDFSVHNTTLRPGALVRAKGPFDYVGITNEEDQLVVAHYQRSTRRVLATARVPGLNPDVVYRLKIQLTGRTLRAKRWRVGRPEPRWMLATNLSRRDGGPTGVLAVHPLNLGSGELRIHTFSVASLAGFGSTKPEIVFALTGSPRRVGTTAWNIALRARTGLPSTIRFEWTLDPTWSEFTSSGPIDATAPPHSASFEDVVFPVGETLYWRVRANSTTSDAEATSAVYTVQAPDPSASLVLAAASCAQLWDQESYFGLSRVMNETERPPQFLMFQGDLGYANNIYHSCYRARADFFVDRFSRTLADPHFARLRRSVPIGFTGDDHDYGTMNNAGAGEIPEWALTAWNQIHADRNTLGYYDFRIGDVHCIALEARRYSERPSAYEQDRTRLGAEQNTWLRGILSTSRASMFVIFSPGIFASRRGVLDCHVFGWHDEYDALMTLFMDTQLGGRRVLIMSGDAHGFRVHLHPDPARRPEATGLGVAEFICSGIRARSWSNAVREDETVIRTRMLRSGLGLIDIDPPLTANRSVTLRAISGERAGTLDLFAPVVLPFLPEPSALTPASLPRAPTTLSRSPQE